MNKLSPILMAPARRSAIGTRIFIAFGVMGAITALLGAYGYYVLSAAGDIAIGTYDGPLMATSYARSASLDFAQMDREALRLKLGPAAERPDAVAALDRLATSFFDDLKVASERLGAADEHKVAAEIRHDVRRWLDLQHGADPVAASAEAEELARRIIDRFDMLIELTADYSFIEHRKATHAIADYEYASIGIAVLAILASAAITWLLTRRIIRPLATAAGVANRIADGEFDTPIPVGFDDETGALLRSMMVMQDSIRVMMEHEVRQRRSAQQRLADAIERIREGMMLVDPQGRIVMANSRFGQFFPSIASELVEGADFERVIAKVRPYLAFRGEMDDAAQSEFGRAALDAQFTVGEFQTVSDRWLRFSRSEIRDGGFFLILSDITDIKAREENYRQAKLEAEAASAAKTNFLTNMSHELRTPLNAIIGFSELMKNELLGPLGTPKYVEYAGDVLQSAYHLLEIINSVLDLAKSGAGKLELRPESVDLCEQARACQVMIAPQAAQGQLDLQLVLPDEPVLVIGEPAKIRQIFLNLLSNAVKFTDPGGKVTLETCFRENYVVEVIVEDTGIGMSPEHLKIAMTPFGQVETGMARRYGGSGLGLPLTKALVELHGGEMIVESKLGHGTKVTIRLPHAARPGSGFHRLRSRRL